MDGSDLPHLNAKGRLQENPSREHVPISPELERSLAQLDDVQRAATTAPEGIPMLIAAGAGSGKTRVLGLRIAWLISSREVRPKTILALTFTRKAKEEMAHRINTLVPRGAEVSVHTFHSFSLNSLKQNYTRLGFQREPTVLDDTARLERLREIIQDLPAHQYQEALQWKPPQDAEREALNRDEEGDGDFSVARGQDKLLVGAVQRLSVFMKWAAKEENRDKKFHKNDLQFSCLETYKNRKKKFNWLDFDDLIPLTIELLKCDYRLLDDFRSRHRVILVDEFQDVSPLQIGLLKLLVDPQNPRITVCGDQDQSIYGFLAGKASSNFQDFRAMFPTSKVIKLSKNYRSTGVLVKAAASLISHNQSLGDTSAASGAYTDNGSGSSIVFAPCATVQMEVKMVCDQIQRCHAEGVPLRQMAVLYRLRMMGREFQLQLSKRKIACVNAAPEWSSNAVKKAVVLDLLAYVRIALSGADEAAMERIANKPSRAIGKSTLDNLRDLASRWRCSRLDAAARVLRVETEGFTKKQIAGFRDLLQTVRAIREDIKEKSAPEVLEGIQNRTFGDGKKLKDDSGVYVETVRMLQEDLVMVGDCEDELLGASRVAEAGTGATARKLLAFTSFVRDTSDLKELRKSEFVTLSTIHQAKGLEFSHVWLVRFSDSLCPLPIRPKEKESEHEYAERWREAIEEERRLAYVAVSRAKKELSISYALVDDVFGMQQEPSRFIENLPQECIISGREAVISRNNINSAAGKQNSPAKKGLGDLRRLSTVSPAENPEALVHDGASDHCLLDGPARENDVDATIQYCKGFQKNKETGKYEQKEGSGEFEEFGTPNVGTTRMGYANKPKPGELQAAPMLSLLSGKRCSDRDDSDDDSPLDLQSSKPHSNLAKSLPSLFHRPKRAMVPTSNSNRISAQYPAVLSSPRQSFSIRKEQIPFKTPGELPTTRMLSAAKTTLKGDTEECENGRRENYWNLAGEEELEETEHEPFVNRDHCSERHPSKRPCLDGAGSVDPNRMCHPSRLSLEEVAIGDSENGSQGSMRVEVATRTLTPFLAFSWGSENGPPRLTSPSLRRLAQQDPA